ncbi:hypothetical protein TUN199_05084 [Pyrenophora tritici-repentis]|nr:hypothetical protein Alg130_04922 [Pyrenophora tritici-repentis]KAI0622929.1 hypothetical protein TUN199_05084 [Pyrenophora tritici-repentis]KAI1671986.1 hypothetical protein L13192_02845 [Pyrenophora tritici-repentis]
MASTTEDEAMAPALTPHLQFLYAAYGSDLDPTTIPTSLRSDFDQLVEAADVRNMRPKVEPSYSCAEKLALESWASQVNHQIRTRILSYQCPTASASTFDSGSSSYTQRPIYTSRSEHQLFRIPELLDTVLGYAGPVAQMQALRVSKRWRTSALDVIRSRKNSDAFQTQQLSLPKEYGQTIDDATGIPLQPSSEKVEQFELQFTINPYLQAFFAENDQITHRLGRWEICLNAAATPETLTLNTFLSSKVLLDAVASMHITNPPCRAIGLYHHNSSMMAKCGWKRLLARLGNNDDIRIGELLDALKRSAPTVLTAWVRNSEWLAYGILQHTHWIDDVWILPGVPTIELHLDNVDMSDSAIHIDEVKIGAATMDTFNAAATASLGLRSHVTRIAEMNAMPFRRSRERAWISEDLIEPAESTTGRHPINWDM